MAIDLGANIAGSTDENVKVSDNDTVAGKLIEKLQSSDNSIGISEVNDGKNEKLDLIVLGGGVSDGNGMFDVANNASSWAVTSFSLGGNTTGSMGANNFQLDSSTQTGLFFIDAGSDAITLAADEVTMGNTGSPSSKILLDNAGSGKIFALEAASGSFNDLSIVLGTTGSVSQINTSGPAWTMNKNLRLDTSGSRSALYVNNGGNGLAISGTNSTAPDIEIDNSGNIGVFGTTPAAQQNITGSRGGNAALASLLTGLANLGWITDSTSA